MFLTPEETAKKLLEQTGIVTVSKFLKASDYKKNPLGKVRTYSVQQGNIYVKTMTTGQRSWGSRAIAEAVIRRKNRTPIIQLGDKFYLSLTNPIRKIKREIYVGDRLATPQELTLLEQYKKTKKSKPTVCIDGKERTFRDFAIEPGAIFHFGGEEIEVVDTTR